METQNKIYIILSAHLITFTLFYSIFDRLAQIFLYF